MFAPIMLRLEFKKGLATAKSNQVTKRKIVRNFVNPQNYQSGCGCTFINGFYIQKVKFLIIQLITFHHIPAHVTQIIWKDNAMLPNFEQKDYRKAFMRRLQRYEYHIYSDKSA